MAERVYLVCSRCGLGTARTSTGSLRHAAGRWSGHSCGQSPDPIPFVAWLMRQRHMDAEADAEIDAFPATSTEQRESPE